jgi:hypothetical protein
VVNVNATSLRWGGHHFSSGFIYNICRPFRMATFKKYIMFGTNKMRDTSNTKMILSKRIYSIYFIKTKLLINNLTKLTNYSEKAGRRNKFAFDSSNSSGMNLCVNPSLVTSTARIPIMAVCVCGLRRPPPPSS